MTVREVKAMMVVEGTCSIMLVEEMEMVMVGVGSGGDGDDGGNYSGMEMEMEMVVDDIYDSRVVEVMVMEMEVVETRTIMEVVEKVKVVTSNNKKATAMMMVVES